MKKITVKLYNLECSENEVFRNLDAYMEKHNSTESHSGAFFNSGEKRYAYSIEDITIGNHKGFLITCVKESGNIPVYFNDDGKISDLPLPKDGAIGAAKYAFVCFDDRFMITDSDAVFKKVFNEFTIDTSIKITPVFRYNVEDIIFNDWGFYKKISAALCFPTHDELAEFCATKEGKMINIVDELGGLKFDITIAAPKQKQVLNTDQLKSFLRSLLANEYCNKLIVKGAPFDTERFEQHDLKKAQVIFSESFATDKIRITDIIHAIQDGYNNVFKNYL